MSTSWENVERGADWRVRDLRHRPNKDPAIYVKNSWRVARVFLTFLALVHQLYDFLYSTLVPQQASGPLRPLVLGRPPASVAGGRRSLVLFAVTPRTNLFCAFTSNMLPTITHYGLHGSSHSAYVCD